MFSDTPSAVHRVENRIPGNNSVSFSGSVNISACSYMMSKKSGINFFLQCLKVLLLAGIAFKAAVYSGKVPFKSDTNSPRMRKKSSRAEQVSVEEEADII